ncbi:tRNA-dihydrouridine [Spathaspora sp. JA1]|nr:tRNA-dihydrouridine [Spathaspora sp. JA1]
MINYGSKICLAPMVRSGELPIRLAALKYGCDLVWTPELIDRKLITCVRTVNQPLGTIDYIEGKNQSLTFRTHPLERGKLILQLGSSNAKYAVEAALKVIEDVDGIDLNCGCPKHFSIHAGMGAALLRTPDVLCEILEALVEKVGRPNNKPISCKIRLLPEYEETKMLVERICRTGISNLTIHCRTPIMRNRQDAVWNYLPRLIPIIQGLGVNVIINGNIQGVEDLFSLQRELKNDQLGIMIAEAAEANPSVFSRDPQIQKYVVKEVFEICKKYHSFSGSKFLITNIIHGKSKYYQQACHAKSFEDMEIVLNKILEDNDDVRMNKITNRSAQKFSSFTLEEYHQHMKKRSESMSQFFSIWTEEHMLKSLNPAKKQDKRVSDAVHISKTDNKRVKVSI